MIISLLSPLGLVKAVNTAVDLIVAHFGTSRDPDVKVGTAAAQKFTSLMWTSCQRVAPITFCRGLILASSAIIYFLIHTEHRQWNFISTGQNGTSTHF